MITFITSVVLTVATLKSHAQRQEDLCFVKKIHADHIFSVQNPMAQRLFQSKTDGPDAMGLSGTSQPRDLANPLGVEPLSL